MKMLKMLIKQFCMNAYKRKINFIVIQSLDINFSLVNFHSDLHQTKTKLYFVNVGCLFGRGHMALKLQ